jgi:hypothetical protein
MSENKFEFQGQWVAGTEIDSSAGHVLNWQIRKGDRK